MPLLPLLVASLAVAQIPKQLNFMPGDQAPALKVAEWMRGEPFHGWDKKRLNVVEFWATWCGPCKEAMPHLSDLAKKHADVGFFSISVEEQPQMVPEGVRKFVRENESAMQYSVGRDADTGKDANWEWFCWLMGSRQRAIPVAFIVDSGGRVLWVGHPLELDKPIDAALAGKLDWKGERTKFEQYLVENAKTDAFLGKLGPAEKKFESGMRQEAFHDLDLAAGRNHDFQYTVDREKIRLLAIYDREGCLQFARDLRRRVRVDQWWRYLVEFAVVDSRLKDKTAYNSLRIKAVGEFLDEGKDRDAWLPAYAGWILKMAGDADAASKAFDRARDIFERGKDAKDPQVRQRFDSFLERAKGAKP